MEPAKNLDGANHPYAKRGKIALLIIGLVLVEFLAVSAFQHTYRFWLTGEAEYGVDILNFPDGFFIVHVTSGGIALAIGAFQFWPRWRSRHPRLHRGVGLIYVGSVILSAIASFPVAWTSFAGPAANSGLSILGALWLIATIIAFVAILKGRFNDHWRWMVRSYSLALVAVSFRLALILHEPTQLLTGLSFIQHFAISIWLATVSNLLMGEVILCRWSHLFVPPKDRRVRAQSVPIGAHMPETALSPTSKR